MIERIPIESRDQWLADRQHYVGASEVAIVCGESSWGSLAELYAEKRGLRPPKAETPVMKRGRRLEGAVFETLAEERPEWKVVRAAVHVRCPERRLACTPDGFATAPDRPGVGIVQAKVISRTVYRHGWLDDPSDHILGPATPPIYYRLQVLTEMLLNEVQWGVLATLINGEFSTEFQLFDIERDAVQEDRIQFNVARFLRDYLDAGIMPPFEPQRDEQLVRALYPKDDGTEIDLTTDNHVMTLVEDWTEAQAAKKRIDEAEKGIKVELQGKLGHHTYGRLADGRRLSWKLQHRKGHAVPPADFRVLRISSKEKVAE